MPLLLLAALSSPALALELSADGPLLSGSVVTFTLSDAVPGEQVFLAVGQEGTTCPRVIAPSCVEMRRPRLLHRFTASATAETVVVTVPSGGTGTVQAAAASGVSEAFTYGPQGPVILFTGVLASCGVDVVDLDAEYITEGDDMTATAYLDGVLMHAHTMNLTPSGPGTVFFLASADAVPASDCDSLTWVFEVSNSYSYDCVVQGPEEVDLVTSGDLPTACRAW